jgi:hypothetical protein
VLLLALLKLRLVSFFVFQFAFKRSEAGRSNHSFEAPAKLVGNAGRFGSVTYYDQIWLASQI